MAIVRFFTAVTDLLARARRGLTPPPVALLELTSMAYFVSNAVLAAVRLGVPEALKGGPRTAGEVAEAVSADPDAMRRLLRALASMGILSDKGGRYELNALSRFLVDDTPGSMTALLRFAGSDWHHRIWGNLAESVRTGKAGANEVLGMPLFEYLEKHPDAGAVFNAAMVSFSGQVAGATLDQYPLAGVRRIVDVGGGHGQLVAMALARYPELRGTLFDLPHVVKDAGKILDAAGVTARADIVGGDFFKGEVPQGGDVYTLMNIIHDWSDADAERILKRVREAMGPGSRLLVVEMVIPRDNAPYFGTLFDLEMLLLFGGGRERTEDEIRALCRGAGFRVERVLPTLSPSFVVEAFPV